LTAGSNLQQNTYASDVKDCVWKIRIFKIRLLVPGLAFRSPVSEFRVDPVSPAEPGFFFLCSITDHRYSGIRILNQIEILHGATFDLLFGI